MENKAHGCHQFWNTQPVPQEEEEQAEWGVIDGQGTFLLKDPPQLPPSLSWTTLNPRHLDNVTSTKKTQR